MAKKTFFKKFGCQAVKQEAVTGEIYEIKRGLYRWERLKHI